MGTFEASDYLEGRIRLQLMLLETLILHGWGFSVMDYTIHLAITERTLIQLYREVYTVASTSLPFPRLDLFSDDTAFITRAWNF